MCSSSLQYSSDGKLHPLLQKNIFPPLEIVLILLIEQILLIKQKKQPISLFEQIAVTTFMIYESSKRHTGRSHDDGGKRGRKS